MRLGIRTKQIAGVTAIVGAAVVVISALSVGRICEIVLEESHARAQLLANAISHRARDVVLQSDDPYTRLREDSGMRALLESALYSANVTHAAIVDSADRIVAANDATLVGRPLEPDRSLTALIARSPLDQLRVIWASDGQTLEVRQPLVRDLDGFATVSIGVSTLLIRDAVKDTLRPTFIVGLGTMVGAVFVAALLAQLLLRPIHVIRSGLTRLGRGEFGVTLDLPPGDEFGELGSFFNTVSRQLSEDRSALAGQKAGLQSAVEHLEEAVALFNPSGELLFCNPAMQRALPAATIGTAVSALLPNGHAYRTIVEETLATRRSRGPVEVNADGATLLTTNAITGTDGELAGVLLVARDLASMSRVQSTIAYSRKLVALGRLTAGIAHEVKNPLNAMMIHLELLRTKIRRGLAAREPAVAAARGSLAEAALDASAAKAEAGLEHVEIIENEIRRLDEVVQGFIKFTRPEDLRLQPVNVRSLFEEIQPVLDPEAQRNQVRITVDCAPALAVNGDAAMLRQAFLNLAINACQAMPQGGTLRLSATGSGRDTVAIRVEDTGIGIPPENLGRIFDLYFTTKDHGSGIGLSMVFRIVQMHDGDVEVQSTPGHGTTFTVTLPRANEV